MRKRLISKNHILGEIAEVAAGEYAARRSGNEISLFKSVGVAVQDTAAAAIALKRAEDLNIGTLVVL